MEEELSLDTPMMRQYWEIKQRYQEEILFFRMGDFYEMFLDDAIFASRVLDIALTRRQDKIPMCGIPCHAAANYIHRLLKTGRKIAVCEQIEEPSATKKLLQRDVVRILTPGSIYEEELLDSNSRTTLAAFYGNICTISDLSTGELFLLEANLEELSGIFESYDTKELILPIELEYNQTGLAIVKRPLPVLEEKVLEKFLGTPKLAVFGFSAQEKKALALLFSYLEEIHPSGKPLLRTPRRIYRRDYMFLDETCLKTLEILEDQSGTKRFSLRSVLDKTQTPAGRRLLSQYLTFPSLNLQVIQERHDTVDFFLQKKELRDFVREKLKQCYDLARILQQLHHKPQVRHLGEIYYTLEAIDTIKSQLEKITDIPQILKKFLEHVFPQELYQELRRALWLENLPPVLDERRFVRLGYNKELDELFYLSQSAQTILRELEERERQKYNINGLKLRYNKILGYFFEVPRGQTNRVPAHYHRRQTLTTGERYTSEELQELESRLLNAQEDIVRMQSQIFEFLRKKTQAEESSLQIWAELLSELDVLAAFALVAEKNNYVRPQMHSGYELILKESRHPVVEQVFKEEVFVPNDCKLSRQEHLAIITGPNMAGKSTYIRQVGLIVIMAHAGSFVPASYALIPLTDRVFTRIGAYDRLARGESTFFVEMAECARIFGHYSSQSLILLDEVGRGTSTYDGISIARAMIEYLNDERSLRPKVLFATHYAELAELIAPHRGIVGLTVLIEEIEGRIVFLRKIVPGSQSKSYGIHVAELAGMPREITDRARQLLAELEEEGLWQKEPVFRPYRKSTEERQLPLF